MKILLHGATMGSNFGDFLFAKMFRVEVEKVPAVKKVYYYESRWALSDFFKKHLEYDQKYSFRSISALVLFGGGYFLGNDRTIKDYVLRFLRYFLIALKCYIFKKPYAIIGVDVGISKNKCLQYIQKIVLKHARIVAVRNTESLVVMRSIGLDNVILTADPVFALDRNLFQNERMPGRIQSLNGPCLFLHINPHHNQNVLIINKVIPVINKFIESHQDYNVVVACDQAMGHDNALEKVLDAIETCNKVAYIYDKPMELCKVVDRCELIVTTKLHIGIVGAHLGKSVISFAGHADKIQRLYNQLGEGGRTIPLEDLTLDGGVEMLEKNYKQPTMIPKFVQDNAELNFVILRQFIQSVNVNE